MFIRLVRIKQKCIRIAYLYSKCTDCRIKTQYTVAQNICSGNIYNFCSYKLNHVLFFPK